MDVRLKQARLPPAPADGRRVLVDPQWPRGVSRVLADLDSWPQELAPSAELLEWFGHEPARFDEFRRRYIEELRKEPASLAALRQHARRGTLTLLYGGDEAKHNHAAVLADVLRSGLPEEA